MYRTEDKPLYDLSPEEVLSLLGYGEARGEIEAGQIAVMWTVRNRVQAGGWFLDKGIVAAGLSPYHAACLKNAPVHKIVYQYSCFQDDDPNRLVLLRMAKEQNFPLIELAKGVVGNMIEDPTHGACYYYNPKVCNPAWASSMDVTATIGHHIFGKIAG
ncbi:MAG TPA: cell wall hydrolase [Dissulfurispiraceae bacterium]